MRSHYFGIVMLSLSALAGCGKGAKAKKQELDTASLPPFPSVQDNVFALEGGKTSVSYKSTMVIMNPAGDPNQLAELIRASELTRIRAAEAKAFVGNEREFDRRYGDSGSVATEIKAKQEDLKVFLMQAQSRAAPIPLASRQKAAASWFAAASSQPGLAAEETTKLQSIFANYCDAKIVELAAHPLFARLSSEGYKERPSPNQLCEDYYKVRGYFQGETCTKGDYFACMWLEGVLKSATPVASDGESLEDTLKSLFTNKEKAEEFRKILMADEAISSPYIKPGSSLIKDAIYKKKVYFYTALQSGKPSIGTEAGCIKLLDPSFAFICGQLARSWKATTPQASLLDVEFNSALQIKADSPEIKLLSDAVKYFGQRPVVGSPQASNSDYYFHSLTPPEVLTQPSAESLGLSQESITAITNLFLDKVFSMNAEDRAIKDQKEADLAALKQELNYHRSERDRLTVTASDALRAGIRAANGDHIAFGFIAYRMSVSHSGSIMRATLSFEGHEDQVFQGCLEKSSETPIECPPGMAEAGSSETLRKAVLRMNPAKGRIEFSMALDEPEAVGLGYKPKNEASPDYFMELEPDQIRGMNLTFQLYPNRLQQSLDILTGKAIFDRGGPYLYEAGVSMWEE